MNAIMIWIAKLAIGNRLISFIASANAALSGHRTQILGALWGLIFLLKKIGIIPPDLAPAVDALATGLLGAIPVTLAEKASRVKETVDKLVPDQK